MYIPIKLLNYFLDTFKFNIISKQKYIKKVAK